MMRENSADGQTQNTNHQNVMKRRVGRNGRANSMMINTLIDHREVGDEIKQVKRLSFLPTIEVDNADYFNKIDTDDETQKALRSHGNLKKESLPVVNIERFSVSKLKAGFKTIKSHNKLENEEQQIKLDNEKVRREHEKRLITLQQNSGGYIDDEDDCHDQSKSNLFPFVSTHSELLNEMQGYLDLTAEEIAQKYDLIQSQREALGISSVVIAKKALHVVQEKSVGGVETYTIDNLRHILTYIDDHRQHRFKDESCTYCKKKGHTETVCFSKCDDEKLTNMVVKISAIMADKIATRNNEALESVLKEIEKLNLKG